MSAFEAMRVVERPVAESVRRAALDRGYTQLQASVVARRLPDDMADSFEQVVRPSLSSLDPPDLLPDIEIASRRIAQAVICEEDVIIVVDHDCDGISSLMVIYGALIDAMGVDPARIHCYSSHRLNEGYGVSDGVVDRILADGHSQGLLITADQGSADEPRIARLAAAGIQTVVTDHHGIDGAGPPSALACVNPCRADSEFPDKFVAGCHVAWLVMAQTRRALIQCGHLTSNAPKLGFLLPFSALGTTADCVSFARSRNNRLIVQHGLHLINTRPDPCWQALAKVKGISGPVTSETLGWIWGPSINAGGRLDDAMPGFYLFRSSTLDEAMVYAEKLHAANIERRGIEQKMRDVALMEAEKQVKAGARGISVWMKDGHSGIHGVVASRLASATGRPALCISPKQGEKGIVTASARACPGFHVRNAFAWIDAEAPGMLKAWGGHEGAGGMRADESDIERLQQLWNQAAMNQVLEVGPQLLTDGPLPGPPTLSTLAELAVLEPYGREFDAPVFAQEAWLISHRRVGEDGKHLQVELQINGESIKGIWFSAGELAWKPMPGDCVTVVFTLSDNTYKGRTTVQALIQHMDRAHKSHSNLP